MALPADLSAILSFPYVIFDMDGTLLDSEPKHALAWNAVGHKYGLPEISPAYLAQVGGIPTLGIAKMLCEEHHLSVDPALIARDKIKMYLDVYMHEAECFPDMVELVKKFSAKGSKIAVATGSQLFETEHLLKKYGVFPYLATIVSADQVQNGKPAPDTYLTAMERMGGTPDKTLVFEDTPIGFKGVKAAGMSLVRVKGGKLLSGVIAPENIVLA